MNFTASKKLRCDDFSLLFLMFCIKQEVFLNSPESMATDVEICDEMKKFVRGTDNECSMKHGEVALIKKRVLEQEQYINLTADKHCNPLGEI